MSKYWLSVAAAVAIVSLSGCGSNSASTNKVGVFTDSPVDGLNYECNSTSGVTSNGGKYDYQEGDICKFSIGDLVLGTAKGQGVVSPVNLAEDSEKAIKIAQLLQSFDSDGDTSEKITISESFKEAINKNDFNLTKDISLVIDDILNKHDELKTGNEKKVTYEQAFNHMKGNGIAIVKSDLDVTFKAIATPSTESEKTTEQASDTVYVNGKKQTIGYKTILNTGHSDNGEVFGQVKDYQDKPITFTDGSPYICNGTNSGVGSGLDYTSFLNKNGKLYMVSQFECQVGAMYMAELEQDSNGTLTAKENSLQFISQKDEFGGYVHCAGQKTPWESHLGSEEYEPDARSVEKYADATTGLTGNKYYDEVAKFWGGDIKKASPYYYGWTPEVTIDADGKPQYTKHYAMGRMSHELSYVMPDKKTVYLSDDGTNVGLFMFVADKAEDLSAGTMYAAKWKQTSSENGGSADISWIELGHGTNDEIRKLIDPDGDITTNDAITFSDIFETAEGNSTTGTCPDGFTSINTSAYHECLKVKDGQETAAAFLETRRYAALKGATTEFRKEEGITFDPVNKKLYVAMSSIERGMEDNAKSGSANTKYDIGGNNDIKLDYNYCGAVYELDVDGAYQATNMKAVVLGEMIDTDTDGNKCHLDKISNPDNVTFLEGSDILIIGEDTSKHINNVVWAYNTKTKSLDRIFTTPLDAETTSPFWYKDINGFGYLSVVTQHPMEDQNGATDTDKESSVGYVGPFDFNATKNPPQALKKLSSYDTKKEGGSEIVAYCKSQKRMYVTNGEDKTLDIIDISDVNNPSKVKSVDITPYGNNLNSVAVAKGKVAVAVEDGNSTVGKKQGKGKVVVFDAEGTHLQTVEAGYLPDMVTFNEDGTKIIVANEGEPNDSYTVDPIGSIGVINVSDYSYTDIKLDGTLTAADDGTEVRLGGTPSNNQQKDLEPEYVTVSGNYAYVTLQENNALVKVDLSDNTVSYIKSLGAKSWENASGNTLDIEEEGTIKMQSYPGLFGLYQPDSIASFTKENKTYLVTANEGDGREYIVDKDDTNQTYCENTLNGDWDAEDGCVTFIDEKKIKKMDLDSTIASAYTDDNDLKVMTDLGKGTDGNYTKLYTYGARSFSIWDEAGDLVWDSGDQISKKVAELQPELFNQDEGEMDGRSGNKASEPEALTVGTIGEKTYAFVGLERQNAIMVYDITDPTAPVYKDYIYTEKDGDISPEGMKFIPAVDSPNNKNLLLVSYEVSGTTVAYEVTIK